MLNVNLNPEDIDILIPEIFLKEKWNEFRTYLESKKYILIDLHEHTFIKNRVLFSYASIENLYEFAGIPVEKLNMMRNAEISYLTLSLKQYLQIYKKSSLDGYRINKKEKKDYEKIVLIEEKLISKK